MFGVFRVKNHDFTPTNLIFYNFRGAPGAPPLDPPLMYMSIVEQYILAIVFVLRYDRYIFSVERAFINCEKGWL
jgi:hypothetical protein